MTSSSGEGASSIDSAADSTVEAADTSRLNSSTETSSQPESPQGESGQTAVEQIPYSATPVTMQNLLDAGAHFGHQVQRWNPKMMPYIFGERNGVHIINLDLTLDYWSRARKFVEDLGNRGGNILFVGTKLQARDIVKQAALRTGAFSVTQRWLGGTLSNFETIKRSISRMRKLEELLKEAADEDSKVKLNKKERLSISRDLTKLEANLGGIREMRRLPDALFIVDVAKESIAVSEARNLQIPVIALVDTNVNPTLVDFPIPSNDDAARTLRLLVDGIADAFAKGRAAYNSRGANDGAESTDNGSSDAVVPRASKNKKGNLKELAGKAGDQSEGSKEEESKSVQTPAAAS